MAKRQDDHDNPITDSTNQDRAPASFGAVILKYRTESRLSQPDLADLVGVSRNTIVNWENEKCKPDFDKIRLLCTYLSIPLFELFDISGQSIPNARESRMLNNYRQLNEVNRNVADGLIFSLYKEQVDARDRELQKTYTLLPLQSTAAAAGTGNLFTELPPRPLFVKKNSTSENADAVIRVSGASMEPLYRDGDMVYVKYTGEYQNGDDVVCSTPDGAVIKRAYDNRLFSLNSKYPFPEKSEDDHVTVLGRVLGIAAFDDLADESEIETLNELRHAEIRAFEKKYHID